MVIDINELSNIREHVENQTIIFAGGVFDLMHPGHLDLFKRMKAQADICVIAVSTDKRVKQRKGLSRPIHDEKTRAQIVGSVKNVDYCLIAPEPDGVEVPTVQILRILKPDYFMSCDKSWLRYQDMFDELNVKLLIIPRFSDDISTTLTIEKIKKLKKDTLKNTLLRKLLSKSEKSIKYNRSDIS